MLVDPQPKPGYREELGMAPEIVWPFTDELKMDLDELIHEAARSVLVVRRALDVEYTRAALPLGLATTANVATSMPGVQAQSVRLVSPGHTATTSFLIPDAAIQLAQSGSARLPYGDVVAAARRLAQWENDFVLRSLEQAAEVSDQLPPAMSLVQSGYVGALAAFTPVTASAGDKPQPVVEPEAGTANVTTYVVPVADATCPKVMLEPGPQNVRLTVGNNYALTWVGREGADHRFEIALGLAVIVHDGKAIRAL